MVSVPDVGHVGWAVLALVSYSLVAPLVSVGTREVPSDVALVIANGILVAVALVVVYVGGQSVGPYLAHPASPYLYAAGLCLAVGILAYYRALAEGPVSVVVPIFGMFVVTSSVVGVLLLDESLTARKALGIALAVVAVYLTAGTG